MNPRSPFALVAASSAWMSLAGNFALWRELGSLGLAAGALAPVLAAVMAASLVAILSLLAWRPTLKAAILVLLFATALAAHFMLRYGVVIDAGMLVNAMQTDRHESAALLDGGLVFNVGLLALLPAAVVWRWPVNYAPAQRQAVRNAAVLVLALLAATASIAAGFQPLASAMRNHKQLRYLMNPLNAIYAAGRVAAEPLRRGQQALAPLGRDAVVAAPAGARPALLVLVLGETARSGNFGINGYARLTTPELQAAGAASFRSAWSCGTSTAASLPCMFSHLGREAFDARGADSENLLDVLRHAGLGVLWLDNQSGCKGVCDRIEHAQAQRAASPACAGGECFDEVLLEGLDERIAALPAAQRSLGVVVVLHQMGSHGPAYAQRSPAASKRFLPECRGADLQACSREELLNAYDNSIAYTDHVLGRTIAWLRSRRAEDTALVYLSDHGESLGENGLYLHGLPWALAPDVQKHVPWITWLSPGFEARTHVAMECLRGRAGDTVSHDHLFHSVLGLMRVRTSAYRQGLDAYAACASH